MLRHPETSKTHISIIQFVEILEGQKNTCWVWCFWLRISFTLSGRTFLYHKVILFVQCHIRSTYKPELFLWAWHHSCVTLSPNHIKYIPDMGLHNLSPELVLSPAIDLG